MWWASLQKVWVNRIVLSLLWSWLSSVYFYEKLWFLAPTLTFSVVFPGSRQGLTHILSLSVTYRISHTNCRFLSVVNSHCCSYVSSDPWRVSDLKNVMPLTVLFSSCKPKPVSFFRELIYLFFYLLLLHFELNLGKPIETFIALSYFSCFCLIC